MTRSNAPWTEDQVKSLNAYQMAGYVHPFTGGKGEILIATTEGWSNGQDWAHTFMTDWSWQPKCERCGAPRALWQTYCGAGCSARAEAGR